MYAPGGGPGVGYYFGGFGWERDTTTYAENTYRFFLQEAEQSPTESGDGDVARMVYGFRLTDGTYVDGIDSTGPYTDPVWGPIVRGGIVIGDYGPIFPYDPATDADWTALPPATIPDIVSDALDFLAATSAGLDSEILSGNAPQVCTYDPATDAYWTTIPTATIPSLIGEGLDYLVQSMAGLDGEILGGNAPQVCTYTPGTPGDWGMTVPSAIGQALDELAGAVNTIDPGVW